MDMPDISEVEEWLKLPGNSSECGDRTVCAALMGDKRFHPAGIPKVFAYLRFSSDVARSQAVLSQIIERHERGSLPYPILYGSKSYQTGADALQDWPKIRCLLGI